MTIQSSPSTLAGRLTGARHVRARRQAGTAASSPARTPGAGFACPSPYPGPADLEIPLPE
ncbi:hypothetical protein J2X01_004395 [Arthrobacter ginsengisoli]|uniref:Uncharacterized protein n=1 Tax=Arthrobacter ginsengisoli TaxID=1356565 RepID=A0ABU1UIX8_9MICC|nr:hypothetical protein [Arthrobacter ginsengisoli]MDR7085075.1 hypothetical protein [Arthrobacter ginsengisoli]